MGDMAEIFRAIREANKKAKEKRLREAQVFLQYFEKHTDYHYSLTLAGDRLDYWPSTGKWRWRDKNYHGTPKDLMNFMKRRINA